MLWLVSIVFNVSIDVGSMHFWNEMPVNNHVLIQQTEGPLERVSPAIIAENSDKKLGGFYLGTLSLFYDQVLLL